MEPEIGMFAVVVLGRNTGLITQDPIFGPITAVFMDATEEQKTEVM